MEQEARAPSNGRMGSIPIAVKELIPIILAATMCMGPVLEGFFHHLLLLQRGSCFSSSILLVPTATHNALVLAVFY